MLGDYSFMEMLIITCLIRESRITHGNSMFILCFGPLRSFTSVFSGLDLGEDAHMDMEIKIH